MFIYVNIFVWFQLPWNSHVVLNFNTAWLVNTTLQTAPKLIVTVPKCYNMAPNVVNVFFSSETLCTFVAVPGAPLIESVRVVDVDTLFISWTPAADSIQVNILGLNYECCG